VGSDGGEQLRSRFALRDGRRVLGRALANEEHIQKLREGAAAWNAWREQNPAIRPDLADLDVANAAAAARGEPVAEHAPDDGAANPGPPRLVAANFGGADLSGVDLSGANFAGVNFRGANLSRANLSRANLSGADLGATNLSRADLSQADLSQADLGTANLGRADLSGANLSEADLGSARLSRARLFGAGLMHANLRCADLRGADFSGTDLTGADLSWAMLGGTEMRMVNLSNTDLTEVTGLMLDSCRIVHARFSPNAKDPWSILRRTYTGFNLILNLLCMLLFFAPLVMKSAGAGALGTVERRAVDVLNRLDRLQASAACAKPDQRLINTAQDLALRVPRRSEPMWQVLIGVGGPYGVIMPLLTVILIAYQIARYLMTRQVSLMRDAEERSGISPSLEGTLTYARLYRAHRVLTVVFWTGMAGFALRAIEFLFLTNVAFPV
jgi:uncharacterized protein YjbI with pentapeptide repeats